MSDHPISFDDVPAPTGAVACARCHRSLTQYWAVDGAVLCEQCKEEVLAERTSSEGRAGRVMKASAFGLGGMLVGAGVWYGVAAIADLQIGLIAILLGWLVGKGVYLGSGKRGGLGYQIMAIAITYFGIGAANVPFALQSYAAHDSVAVENAMEAPVDSLPATALGDSPVEQQLADLDSSIAAGKALEAEATSPALALGMGLLALVALTFALPVLILAGGGSFITVIIYGIAIWESFKLTRRTDANVSGPHPVAGAAS